MSGNTQVLPDELLNEIFTLAAGQRYIEGGPPSFHATVSLLSRAWRELGHSRLFEDVTFYPSEEVPKSAPICRLIGILQAHSHLVCLVKRVSLQFRFRNSQAAAVTDPVNGCYAVVHLLLSIAHHVEYLNIHTSYRFSFSQFDLSSVSRLHGKPCVSRHCESPARLAAEDAAIARQTSPRLTPRVLSFTALEELVVDRLSCVNRTPFSLPSLRTATFARMFCFDEIYDQLLDPSTFPNLRALALVDYDDSRFGPAPGPSTIIARASRHYSNFPPPLEGQEMDRRAAPMLWVLNHTNIYNLPHEELEEWHVTGVPLEYFHCGRRPKFAADNPSPALTLLRLHDAHNPRLRELKTIYVGEKEFLPGRQTQDLTGRGRGSRRTFWRCARSWQRSGRRRRAGERWWTELSNGLCS